MKNIFLGLLILSFHSLKSQIGLGTNTPDSSAALDVSAVNKGFLPPRMDSAHRNAIKSPAAGLVIYNTTSKSFECFNGTAWYTTVHYVGERYLGGIVFYVYDNGQHGLIAAPEDQASSVRWFAGSFTNTLALSYGVGAGKGNTLLIIANQGYADGQTYAARVCNEYFAYDTASQNIFGGWYLPSSLELSILIEQKDVVGGFVNGYYWSSSEVDSTSANCRRSDHLPGSFIDISKTQTFHVRAIHDF